MPARRPKRAYPSIVAWRLDNNLSQGEAGKLFGISASHWCNLERGTRLAGRQLAVRMANVMNVPLETILQVQRTA